MTAASLGYFSGHDLLVATRMYDDLGRATVARSYGDAMVAAVEHLLVQYPEHADDRVEAARALLRAQPAWSVRANP